MMHNVGALRVLRFVLNDVSFLDVAQTFGVVVVIGYFFF